MAVKGTLAQYVNSGRIAIGDVRFPEELIEALIGRKQPKDNANLTEAEVLASCIGNLSSSTVRRSRPRLIERRAEPRRRNSRARSSLGR